MIDNKVKIRDQQSKMEDKRREGRVISDEGVMKEVDEQNVMKDLHLLRGVEEQYIYIELLVQMQTSKDGQ